MARPFISALDVAHCSPTSGRPGMHISSAAPYLQRDITLPKMFVVGEDDVLAWVGPYYAGFHREGTLKCNRDAREWNVDANAFRKSRLRKAFDVLNDVFLQVEEGPRTWVAFVVFLLRDATTAHLARDFALTMFSEHYRTRHLYLDLVAYAVEMLRERKNTLGVRESNFIGALCDLALFAESPFDVLLETDADALASTGNVGPHFDVWNAFFL
jgi:hypothetical protein